MADTHSGNTVSCCGFLWILMQLKRPHSHCVSHCTEVRGKVFHLVLPQKQVTVPTRGDKGQLKNMDGSLLKTIQNVVRQIQELHHHVAGTRTFHWTRTSGMYSWPKQTEAPSIAISSGAAPHFALKYLQKDPSMTVIRTSLLRFHHYEKCFFHVVTGKLLWWRSCLDRNRVVSTSWEKSTGKRFFCYKT